MKQYKRYPEYKESGVEWIGEMPAHWETKAVWMMFRLGRGRVISNEEMGDHPGQYPVYSSQTENEGIMGYIDTYDFDGEYITWTTDGAKAGTVFYRTGQFNCTNVCGTLLPRNPNLDLRFFRHALNIVTPRFVRYDINPKLMNNVMATIRVQVPPVAEQRAIGNFLDRKTEKIDELTRIKERQIELLHEHRAALINQTVTKGLDPNVEMKPSGVEWIGEIPAHWEVKQIKQIAQFIGGYSEFGSESYTERGIPIFRIGDIAQFIKMADVKRVPIEQVKRLKQNQLCYGDTLIVMIGRRAGESTYYAFDYPSILSAQVAGLRATKADSKFLFYFIHSASFLNTITPLFFGATRDNISKTALMNVKIPFPPDREQTQIVNFLDRKTAQIDELIAIEGRKVELLKEYRQSLISHVVTGKIDIRNEV